MANVKENSSFKIIDPPKAPDKKIGPNRVVMVIKYLMMSLVFAVLIAFSLEKIQKIKAEWRVRQKDKEEAK